MAIFPRSFHILLFVHARGTHESGETSLDVLAVATPTLSRPGFASMQLRQFDLSRMQLVNFNTALQVSHWFGVLNMERKPAAIVLAREALALTRAWKWGGSGRTACKGKKKNKRAGWPGRNAPRGP